MRAAADTTVNIYGQALRTGLKFQEEAVHCWGTILSQAAAAPDWQKPLTNLTAMTGQVMPMTQKQAEEVVGLVERSTRTSTELMKKAVEAAQTPTMVESQAKWMEFWISAMKAVEFNLEALTQISTRAISLGIDFVRRNTEVTQVRVLKAA